MMHKEEIDNEVIRERLAASYLNLDIFAEVEKHAPVRLSVARSGKRANGICPFPGCDSKHNGFVVWPELSDRDKHYFCNRCRRTGDIVTLVREIKHVSFTEACRLLNIPNPYTNEAVSVKPVQTRVKRERQDSEDLAFLTHLYPRMQQALKHERAVAYLSQRAISLEMAQQYGLGYIPALNTINNPTPELKQNSKWCDSLIFPIQTPDGRNGFIGRTLKLWTPGMNEDEHHKLLKKKDIPKYQKTYPSGFFNWSVARQKERLVIVEGPFDALAVASAGIDAVLALCGLGLDIKSLPATLDYVVIGADTDAPGQTAAKTLKRDLYRAGYDVFVCMPSIKDCKDWNEAYRLAGKDAFMALSTLLQSPDQAEPEDKTEDEDILMCLDCKTTSKDDEHRDFFFTETGLCYCSLCRAMDGTRLVSDTLASFRSFAQIAASEFGGIVASVRPIAESFKHTIRNNYTEPEYTVLPALPRDRCPHIAARVNSENCVVPVKCTKKPLVNGWCADHQAAHELLTIGREYNYPLVVINASTHITGRVQWETFATRCMSQIDNIPTGYERFTRAWSNRLKELQKTAS